MKRYKEADELLAEINRLDEKIKKSRLEMQNSKSLRRMFSEGCAVCHAFASVAFFMITLWIVSGAWKGDSGDEL